MAVLDSGTKQAICDAHVTGTRAGGTSTTIPPNPASTCRYDVFESAGTWDVTASAAGHAPASRADIIVPDDGCHAVRTDITLELAPQ